MKKTVIATLLIIVILAATLTGCTFIRANEQRQLEQTLAVVQKGDVKLNVTQMELIDNINSSVYNYVQYGMSVEQAVNYVIEGRIQSKLLTIEAMQFLTENEAAVARRRNARRSQNVANPEDVLTVAEYYEAIITVNRQILDSVDKYVDEYEDNLKKTEVTNAPKENVEKIEIDSGLNEEYIVGESLDLDDLRLRIVYKDGTEKIIPVISSMVDTEFSSESAGDFELILALDVKVEKDGVVETEKIKTENGKYTIKAAPTVKTSTLDDKNYNSHGHSSAYLDSIRYKTEAEIRTWLTSDEAKRYDYNDGKGIPEKINIDEMPKADMSVAEKDAWRRLKTNMNTNYRSAEYYYRSNFESQVLSALQHELYQNVDDQIARDGNFDDSVLEQFAALSANDRLKYERMTVKERKKAFISAISSSLESLYFCPAVENLNEYYYVQHVLFKFDENTFDFIKANNLDPINDKEVFETLVSRQKVREANPLYDPSYECDCNHFDEDGNYIANPDGCEFDKEEYIALGKSNYQYMKDHPTGTYYCPSIAYLPEERNVTEVLAEFADALAVAQAESAQKAKEAFEWFIYRFSDVNSGSFNNDLGYLITPDKADSTLVDGFYAFGKLLGKQANYSKDNEGIYLVDTAALSTDFEAYTKYVCEFESSNHNRIQYVVGSDGSSYAGIHVLILQKVPFTAAADWNAQSFTNSANNKTVSEALKDGIISSRRSKAYSDFTSEKLKDYEKREGVTITKEEKKINALISQYTGQ